MRFALGTAHPIRDPDPPINKSTDSEHLRLDDKLLRWIQRGMADGCGEGDGCIVGVLTNTIGSDEITPFPS